MDFEITPEPSEEERAAIVAALAQDAEPLPSPWAGGVLPESPELLAP
jgi:hypothetical protein